MLNKGLFLSLLWIFFETFAFSATRIKDISSFRGVRSNTLTGMGLVVGLKATGDTKKNIQASKAMAQMFTKLGLPANPEDIAAGSGAVVMVTAELPPFAKIGDRVDAKISVIGDAKSLAGGMLTMTPLAAGDGTVYAVANGSVVVGQATGSGAQVLTVAVAPQSVVVEKEYQPVLSAGGYLTLQLEEPDFTTCQRISEAINLKLSGFFAEPHDLASVKVTIPEEFEGRVVEFISEIEGIPVEVDRKALVVVNERTGTIVMGADVRIAPVAITHGDLAIKIGGNDKKADPKRLAMVKGSTVGELLESLNQLGVKPADLVGILQALSASKALEGELRFL